jgi:hypothetical protein
VISYFKVKKEMWRERGCGEYFGLRENKYEEDGKN